MIRWLRTDCHDPYLVLSACHRDLVQQLVVIVEPRGSLPVQLAHPLADDDVLFLSSLMGVSVVS